MKNIRGKLLEYITPEVQQELKATKQLHHEFLKAFPLDEIPNMTLEQYALGRNESRLLNRGKL